MEQRPTTIIIVAAFLFSATALAGIVGTSLLFPGDSMDRMWELNKPAAAAFHALGKIAGILLLALGIGTFGAAIGLLRRKRWAWWFAVSLFLVNAIGNVVSYVVTRDAVRSLSGVIVSSLFLYFLVQPGVRRYFKEPP